MMWGTACFERICLRCSSGAVIILTTAEQVSELCQSSVVVRLGLLSKVGEAGRIGAGVEDGILATHDWAPLDGDCPANTVLCIPDCTAKHSSRDMLARQEASTCRMRQSESTT